MCSSLIDLHCDEVREVKGENHCIILAKRIATSTLDYSSFSLDSFGIQVLYLLDYSTMLCVRFYYFFNILFTIKAVILLLFMAIIMRLSLRTTRRIVLLGFVLWK